jgi:hypothetical protein
MTLRLQNTQGATQEYRDVAGKEEAREIIATWSDPEKLKATLIDEGEYIWDSIPADEA